MPLWLLIVLVVAVGFVSVAAGLALGWALDRYQYGGWAWGKSAPTEVVRIQALPDEWDWPRFPAEIIDGLLGGWRYVGHRSGPPFEDGWGWANLPPGVNTVIRRG